MKDSIRLLIVDDSRMMRKVVAGIFQEDDQIEIVKSFDNYVKKIGEGEKILFLLSADGFRTLLPEIERYRKTGIRIVHPSEIKADSDTAD